MRYLNKVIFINSAHIPYAEVKLDGNTHFIGTQGVGKSTLLRAVLFFYNADKSRLGIGREQRGFDDFYLPTSDSYIVYEVHRDESDFCVLLFKSQGRAAYRFIDCAYDQRFFIREDGTVHHEWGRISEAIPTAVHRSKIIREYERFRDIIYGNSQNVDKELRRYCIVSSAKFQNIPRTIQNIFLNQSLESKVIKNTIIDSLEFSTGDVSLTYYRDQIKGFKQEYDDVWKWFKMERNGHNKVRDDAESAIEQYNLYCLVRRDITTLIAMLIYAYERDKKELPQKEQQLKELVTELERQKRLLNETEQKFNTENDELNQKIGSIKDFLKTIGEKKKHYADIQIERIAERVGRESILQIELDSIKKQMSTLTDQNRSIKERYDALKLDEKSKLEELKLHLQTLIGKLDADRNYLMAQVQDASYERLKSIADKYDEILVHAENNRNENLQQEFAFKAKIQSIQMQNPFMNRMKELETMISTLQSRMGAEKERKHELEKTQEDIRHVTAKKRSDLQSVYEKDSWILNRKIEEKEAEITNINELLARQEGSLIDWLDHHVAGWEQNLGCVLDEKRVLYNTDLNPRKVVDHSTLYGISLSLDNLECEVRTPEKLKLEKTQLEDEVRILIQTQHTRKAQLETDIEKMELKPQAELKKLLAELNQIQVSLNTTPQSIERYRKELESEKKRLIQWRDEQIAEWNAQLKLVDERMIIVRKSIDKCKADRAKEVEKEQKSLKQRKKEIDADTAAKIKVHRDAAIEGERCCALRQGELNAQMDAELKGAGVNVKQLEILRSQCADKEHELENIKGLRSVYAIWENDKKEYLSKEDGKKKELNDAELRLRHLKQKYEERTRKYKAEIHRVDTECSGMRDEIKHISSCVETIPAFLEANRTEIDPDPATTVETALALSVIKDRLNNKITERLRKLEDFKVAMDAFNANFSPLNTFGFNVNVRSMDDYEEVAMKLMNFIEQDLIRTYGDRISGKYKDVIKRIAHETGKQTESKSLVEKTILDINKDFRENNFVGVIKDIELRATEANDPIVQQMLAIKQFDDEHSFDIGEFNLFSNLKENEKVNKEAKELVMHFADLMDADPKRDVVSLADIFKLEFKVKENDNDTKWQEKLSNVGSDGTDILVKAIVNIMLINVFKRKITKGNQEFRLHCMMDEIGKLHPNNVKGILDFANQRNIYLINSSPTTYNAQAYRYTYTLAKDSKSNTVVRNLLTEKL